MQPFPPTSWSLLRDCRDAGAEEYRASLERLCTRYWGPVHGFVLSRWTRDPERARDLTQAYFLRFLEKDFLSQVDAEKGRFRAFVCASLSHFLANEAKAERASKRRPALGVASLDALREADPRFDVADQERGREGTEFDEDWKRAVLDAVVAELRRRASRNGREALVDCFVRYHLDQEPLTYADLARSTGLPVGSIRNGLSRMKKEFLEVLRAEIADQTATAEDARLELHDLFGI